MSSPESFEELDAWQMARTLTNRVYETCRTEPLCRDYGLADQLRRAAVSIMNNIAEGWESIGIGEKRQAYNYARRSCGEIRSMTYVLLDNHFIQQEVQELLLNHCIRTGKLISGLIRALERRR